MTQAGIPNLAIPKEKFSQNSQAKLEHLQNDLAKLELESSVALSDTASAVPVFQRQGYLEKLGHTRAKWFKRFFVLRDSFLLGYNLQKSDFTTEPRSCVHLGNSRIDRREKNTDRDFCFSITTETGDQFVYSASSDVERNAWVDDLERAKLVTHANMVKLAVENHCLAEEKGLASATREKSTMSLAVFCNPQYIQETPLTGGMEGWLSTTGFNFVAKKKGGGWKRCYFMLRDSHILMFHAGDILSKPRGVMYLVGTHIEDMASDAEVQFKFQVKSPSCGDMIELAASSGKSLARWKTALQVGSRVTYPDYRLLEKERQLLASVVLTPRAPTPRGPGGAMQMRENPPSVLDEEVDVQGNALAPGAVQPYDINGYPILRNPEGKLVDSRTNNVLPFNTPRFSADGEPLDAFNRPLPPNAVPMFNSEGLPIGVGPDGQHYTPDGEIVDPYTPHYDADGEIISQDIVNNASLIAPTIAVAMKVKAKLRGNFSTNETVDAMGRAIQTDASGQVLTQDGQVVPTSARRVEINGKLVNYDEIQKAPAPKKPEAEVEPEQATLSVVIEAEEGEKELGSVHVTDKVTLAQVRQTISQQLNVPDFVFLHGGVPLTRLEEKTRLAIKVRPTLFIRGRELKVDAPTQKFTSKVALLTLEEEKKRSEEEEFMAVLNKVRTGNFLKSVGRDLTK